LPLHRDDGIPLVDYVENERLLRKEGYPREPWIGVFHHPPHMPAWYQPDRHLEAIFRTPAWQRSQPYLRLAIALSQYLADWLQNRLGVPAVCVKHPTEASVSQFSEERYSSNANKCVLQVGWFLRNTEAIYQLQTPPGLRKARLDLPWPWVRRQRAIVHEHESRNGRAKHGHVWTIDHVSNEEYDRLLCRNVVFLELYDVSACNAILECIVRNTPVIVNRHPALAEYLGADYPLFYDSFGETRGLFTTEQILAGHAFLAGLDKRPLDGICFQRRIASAVGLPLNSPTSPRWADSHSR
jgi:hypothetical protein